MSLPSTDVSLGSRYRALQQTIARLAEQYEREPARVQLLAVSKTRSSVEIRDCAVAGQLQFAENYLQEALVKIDDCADLPLTWHFIGRIQRNKTRDIASNFSWVHTVDRPQIAQRLHDQRPPELGPLNVCIQVNLDGASNKGGIQEQEVPELAAAVMALDRLQLRGLMTIPEPADNLASQRQPYRRLAALLQELARDYPGVNTLSMGMSADMEAAIAEGTTLLRIGTALFGPRNTEAP
ncbi:MAG: YggS family pyridoxal phosphate-dependent enzyme [Gammaproteobacteria bacterium]|nr:MAG: YggS family pyridoxal phosphate-dependent enzyme [Gammaproteobacteria bacterium]